MAASLVRGDLAYLAELAISNDVQSQGLGRRLLGSVMRSGVREQCTLSSEGRRAVALYARAGMTPRWPVDQLRAEQFQLEGISADVRVTEATSDDPALVEWDTRISGRPRPQDLAFVSNKCAAQPLWFRHGDETLGYGFVQQ